MNNYFESLNELIKEYFKILSKEIPDFLTEYIHTPEMLKQNKISVSCGTVYSNLYDQMWFSNLDHSVAVALIIWNFTKDKKQTLAGLFHDIATPTFKHSIDFMNGDYEKQESTEELTTKMISNSKEIMTLLERDNLKLEEVNNYHIYPIADNDTPQLAADRLEYTFSNGLGATKKLWNLDKVKKIYESIEVQRNEKGIKELGFKDKKIAEEFVHIMSQLSCLYRRAETKFTMQFLADILKRMFEAGLVSKSDLYTLSEKEMIDKIEKCERDNIATCFKIWENTDKVIESDEAIEEKYCVRIDKVKVRYINPLVRNSEEGYIRLNKLSKMAQKDIEMIMNYETKKYISLGFAF